jgi:ubiquitin C-terminal hydrolase
MFAPQFSGYEQHDAQEFLAFLLDAVHEDLNRVLDKPYVPDRDLGGLPDEIAAAVAWQGYLRRNKSIIVDIFQGQLRSTLCCGTCGHTSTKFDPFMYLSLPLHADARGRFTLDSCLEAFTQVEELTGDERWFCSKCDAFRDATKKLDLWKVPPVLIVHLKRFKFDKYGQRSKIQEPVEFQFRGWDVEQTVCCPKDVDVVVELGNEGEGGGDMGGVRAAAGRVGGTDETARRFGAESSVPDGHQETGSKGGGPVEKGQGGRQGKKLKSVAKYDLYAMSCHHGSLSSGHYTATCRDRESSEWYVV